MEAASGKAAFGFELTYDRETLRFAGLDVAAPARHWKGFGANEVEPGRLIVGGFDPEGLSAADAARGRAGDGTVKIAALRFRTLREDYRIAPAEWTEQILRRESPGDDPGDGGSDHRVTKLSLGRPFPNPARDGVDRCAVCAIGRDTHAQGRRVRCAGPTREDYS